MATAVPFELSSGGQETHLVLTRLRYSRTGKDSHTCADFFVILFR